MKKKKKSNPKKELYIFLCGLLFIPMLSFLFIQISKIVLEFNVLIGAFLRSISFVVMFLFPLIICLGCINSDIKESKKKNKKLEISFGSILTILIFGLIVLYSSLDLLDVIKDSFQGTKTIYIEEYQIEESRGGKRGPSFDIVIWYDNDGNKNELKSYELMNNYDDMGLKIKYYENLGVIESFEYLEKK